MLGHERDGRTQNGSDYERIRVPRDRPSVDQESRYYDGVTNDSYGRPNHEGGDSCSAVCHRAVVPFAVGRVGIRRRSDILDECRDLRSMLENRLGEWRWVRLDGLWRRRGVCHADRIGDSFLGDSVLRGSVRGQAGG